MDNYFRVSRRLNSTDLIKKNSVGATALITDEFWNRTVYDSRKILVYLKNQAGDLLDTVQVKYAIYEFGNGNPYDRKFMQLTSKGVSITGADGKFEILYTGSATRNSYAYLSIIHPNTSPVESMLWKVTIT